MTGGKLITRLIAPVLAVTVLLVGWQFSSQGESLETTVSEEVLAADTLIPEIQQRERIVLAQADTASTAGSFQLGTHYQRLSPTQPTSSSPDQIEVAEVFWYGCPHCYTFDPYLESWKTDLPANVSFVRVPAVWNPLLQLHARAFYTAEALGKDEEMHPTFFREIHVNGNYLDSEQSLQAFFGQFDVSPEDFSNAFNSFAVHTKLQRADDLSRRYRIASVPTVIVNGKYTTDASMAGNYDTLMDLVDELIALEATGN
jgi:thiol:disulfide interchange protein DsbA